MCPLLSATGTYNYKLAKWLDEKLKPLSSNDHTVGDIFSFADDLHEMEINDHDILLPYDVSALLLNKCACTQNNRNPCRQTIFLWLCSNSYVMRTGEKMKVMWTFKQTCLSCSQMLMMWTSFSQNFFTILRTSSMHCNFLLDQLQLMQQSSRSATLC